MRRLLLSWLIVIPSLLCSQAYLTVNKKQLVIGDHVEATIQVNLQFGQQWMNADNPWPDSIPGIEIVSGPVKKQDGQTIQTTWTLAVFDTGVVRIPRLSLSVEDQRQKETIYTNDVPLTVSPIEPDSSGLLPIKPIVRQPFSLVYYKKYLPHIILVVAIIVGIIYFLLKRRKTKSVIPVLTPPAAHEWALKELNLLAEKKLWQRGEVKEHYSLLTDILREYLERRYKIHAKEQTTDEILVQVKGQLQGEELLHDTEQLLSIADLIKFAKADPGVDIHATTIDRVKAFVHQTRAIPDTPVSSKPGQDEVVG